MIITLPHLLIGGLATLGAAVVATGLAIVCLPCPRPLPSDPEDSVVRPYRPQIPHDLVFDTIDPATGERREVKFRVWADAPADTSTPEEAS